MKTIIEIQYNIVNNIHKLVYPENGIEMSIRDAVAHICRKQVLEYDLEPLYQVSQSSCRNYFIDIITFNFVLCRQKNYILIINVIV